MNDASTPHRGDLLLPAPALPLEPKDAAVAVLTLPDGRYVLQRRDAKPSIFYPDHWGLFGGALEEGENPEEALIRELAEELELRVELDRATYFTEFRYDLRPLGGQMLRRWFYDLEISDQEWSGATLGEGCEVAAFDLRAAFRDLRIVPYDEFVLWLHGSRHRLILDSPTP